MIDVLDRVPTKPGRIKITHDDGTVEYVTTERADEPVEVGTPIDKALFDKIISRLFLTNKYNTPNILVENSINNLSIDEPLDKYEEKQLVRMMVEPQEYDSFSTGIFPTTFSESVTVIDGFATTDYEVFDGDNTYGKSVSTNSSGVNLSAKIECPYAIKPEEITLTYKFGYKTTLYDAQITILGSNNGVDWETIASETVSTSSTSILTSTYTVNSSKSYCYFKANLYWAQSAGGYIMYIYSFNITKGKKSKYNRSFPSQLSIGGLPAKSIDEVINPNTRYTLCYQNDTWVIDAEEVMDV